MITCAPNFPEGRLFAGYENRWRQVETIDGIRVVRVKSYSTANEGFARRTLCCVTVRISSSSLQAPVPGARPSSDLSSSAALPTSG